MGPSVAEKAGGKRIHTALGDRIMFDLVVKAHNLMHVVAAPHTLYLTKLEEKPPATFCKYADLGDDGKCSMDDVLRFDDETKMNLVKNHQEGLANCLNIASNMGPISVETYIKECSGVTGA